MFGAVVMKAGEKCQALEKFQGLGQFQELEQFQAGGNSRAWQFKSLGNSKP
jgi:hypothetical protein